MDAMKTRSSYAYLACAALALLVETLPAPAAIPMAVGIAGDYKVVVEVLPPTLFTGAKAKLVVDGGDQPVGVGGSKPPNHRLAVTVSRNGRPVERADVAILYRNLGSGVGAWVSVPVVRTHAAGEGLETTQFGNNVRLGPGMCQIGVRVNGQGEAIVRFLLRS
jgi:hypothetical protein